MYNIGQLQNFPFIIELTGRELIEKKTDNFKPTCMRNLKYSRLRVREGRRSVVIRTYRLFVNTLIPYEFKQAVSQLPYS